MSCNCNITNVRATSIVPTTSDNDTFLTITVPATTDLTDFGCINVLLATTIPTTVNCARIVITNGTVSLNVLRDNGNYWRPCRLKCRSILRMTLLTDPAHLLIRGVGR